MPTHSSLIVVADSADAHFYRLEAAELPQIEGGPHLVSVAGSLQNSAATERDSSLWSDSRSGANQNAGRTHAYDDHRTQHQQEYLKRFAQTICTQAAELLNGDRSMVLVAEGHMLGMLRECIARGSLAQAGLTELNKNLTSLSTQELHAYLAQEGLVPARKPRP